MASENNELFGIIPVLGTDIEDRKLDIVFIHGLAGHAERTWGDVNEVFWPTWLGEDFTNIAVWTVGYDATPSAWLRDTMPMEDRALNILNDLSLTGRIGERPILFIVHSMGGLILKYMLEKSKINDRYSHILAHTKGVVFLAVPHDGASGANFLNALSNILRVNDIVKQLQKNASALDRLDGSFNILVQQEKLECISFFETKEVRLKRKIFGWKGIKVVGKASAKGRFPQQEPIGIDADHIEICKLKTKTDQVYKNIKPLIQKILDDDHTNSNYIDILNSLPEPEQKEAPPSVNQVFLIFNNDDISDIKYDVIGYIQAEDEFENEMIEFTFEDITNEKEQESFLEKLIKEAEMDNIYVHFILPPSLFLVNFKQWKYKGTELVKLYHVLLHNKEKFMRKIGKYRLMIENWNELFEQLKDTNITEALSMIHNSNERFDARNKKIGACFKYILKNYDVIQDTLIATNIGLWQYQSGIMDDYKAWINSGVCLNQLNQNSRECDHIALLWDDMSLLEKLKRKV